LVCNWRCPGLSSIYIYLFMRLVHDGTPLFPNLGVHCSYPSCAQLDFLPFRCSQCEKVYCLDHRTCDAHECTAASSSSSSAAGGFVVVCPICAAAVPLASTQDDANLAWERHRTSGACDEANYARVHKKPVCPAPGCRQKLNLSNKVVCKNCGIATCLKHRFPEDHKCTKRRAGGGGAGVLSALNPSGWAAQMRAASKPSASTARPPRTNPPPARTTRSGGSEVCPQCGSHFPNVAALIAHVESAHPNGVAQSASSLREVCPQCGARFADVAALIAHAEAAHTSNNNNNSRARRSAGNSGSSSSSSCILC